jgi:hypothetical protein
MGSQGCHGRLLHSEGAQVVKATEDELEVLKAAWEAAEDAASDAAWGAAWHAARAAWDAAEAARDAYIAAKDRKDEPDAD